MDSRDPITSVTSHCVSASRSGIPTVDSTHGQVCFLMFFNFEKTSEFPANPFRGQGCVWYMVSVDL